MFLDRLTGAVYDERGKGQLVTGPLLIFANERSGVRDVDLDEPVDDVPAST